MRKTPHGEDATDLSLAENERRHIAAVLERTGGNVTEAAEILEVDRVTVYDKIKKFGLRNQRSNKE